MGSLGKSTMLFSMVIIIHDQFLTKLTILASELPDVSFLHELIDVYFSMHLTDIPFLRLFDTRSTFWDCT